MLRVEVHGATAVQAWVLPGAPQWNVLSVLSVLSVLPDPTGLPDLTGLPALTGLHALTGLPGLPVFPDLTALPRLHFLKVSQVSAALVTVEAQI